jgi:predicted enzyme related to lactoylglutathione lyase
MSNIAYFEVPADDLQRARKFYQDLLGWEFMQNDVPGIPMEYWNITTGAAEEGTLNMGGMYQRQGPVAGILTYVRVDAIDSILAKVEKLGGKVINPKMTIETVGSMATILDSEGNVIALHEPEQVSS